MTGWQLAFVVATAAHLGFQLTVTFVVYPAFVGTPEAEWQRVHGGHTRRITPLVVVIYGALGVTGAAVLFTARSAATIVGCAAALVAVGLTLTLAGPTHAQLARGRNDALIRRLLLADRGRTVAALVASAAAVAAAAASMPLQ